MDPTAIEFRLTDFGKPLLARASGLEFNVSHSSNAMVCAIAHRPVGIDVEYVRPIVNARDIATRFFSAAEIDALRRVDDEQLMTHFFTCWTRKEAYIKAIGKGLTCRLDGFSVSIEPARPALLHADSEPDGPRRWSLSNLDFPGECGSLVGALAVESGAGDVVHRQWPQ
jgi:4'-phosphopantetheinyl transferase